MTAVRHGIDLALSLLGALAWSFAALVLGSRFISPAAGGLLALALFFSGCALLLSSELQDRRMSRLTAGECPRCRHPVAMEHRHRRWEPGRGEWLPPLQIWECADCGYAHSESWACPACPAPS